MAVELAGISLEHLTRVAVRERARIVRHSVPGMSGDLAQTLGRPSVEVTFWGIFYGAAADDDLAQLRQAHLGHEPVDFFTEAVGEGYFSQVLVTDLTVAQRAGYADQFDFTCTVVEYVVPPEPVLANPLAALDGDLLAEATGFIDDVQNALEQVSQLADLIANVPSFADPTSRLPAMLDAFSGIASGGTGVVADIRNLF
jgi:hypothetical protein